jgi:hypothetical protein
MDENSNNRKKKYFLILINGKMAMKQISGHKIGVDRKTYICYTND